MRKLFLTWIAGACLMLAVGTTAHPQDPANPPPAPPAAQKAAEPPKPTAPTREPASPVVSYTLAAIGILIVMVLVCMPARRE